MNDAQYPGSGPTFAPPSGQPAVQPQPAQYNQSQFNRPPKKSRNWGSIIAIAAIVCACIAIVFSSVSCSSAFVGAIDSLGLKSDANSYDSTPKVGVISIDGSIQYDGTSASPSGLRTLLNEASDRDDIKAVVLVINSGGGTATAGEEMSKYVKDFKKPIVVSCAATTASAAYEIASQANYIYTAKTSSVGSIGVALQLTDLSGLYRMLGINIENITSSDSKDSTYGNRPLTEDERAWYQSIVNQINDVFIATVAEGRNLSEPQVRQLANGLAYTGIDAVNCGLCDEIGYLQDAVSKASKLSGSDKALQTTTLTLPTASSLSSLIDVLGESGDDVALRALVEKYGKYSYGEALN